MPASPSWSRGRRSGTAVLSGEGREGRCPILPGRRSDGESRPPRASARRHIPGAIMTRRPPSRVLLTLLLATLFVRSLSAQRIPASQHGSVTQRVGSTDIAASYNRPVARGPRLFGELVPWGTIW